MLDMVAAARITVSTTRIMEQRGTNDGGDKEEVDELEDATCHIKWGGKGGGDQEDDGCDGTMVAAAGGMATAGGGMVAIVRRTARQEAGQQLWQ
jgi:hypothetical protein